MKDWRWNARPKIGLLLGSLSNGRVHYSLFLFLVVWDGWNTWSCFGSPFMELILIRIEMGEYAGIGVIRLGTGRGSSSSHSLLMRAIHCFQPRIVMIPSVIIIWVQCYVKRNLILKIRAVKALLNSFELTTKIAYESNRNDSLSKPFSPQFSSFSLIAWEAAMDQDPSSQYELRERIGEGFSVSFAHYV